MSMKEANKVIHPVETEWHYPTMMKYGFEAVTKSGTGLVRSYYYRKDNHLVRVTTGFNSDHWSDNRGGQGLWGDLEHNLIQNGHEAMA